MPEFESASLGRAVELWRAAQRWRRRIDRALAPFELTLTQWLVLRSTAVLVDESDDATSQTAVAARAQIDPMSVSRVMQGLEVRGLVDRGPEFSGPAYRVFVTASGKRVLATATKRVLEACRDASVGITQG